MKHYLQVYSGCTRQLSFLMSLLIMSVVQLQSAGVAQNKPGYKLESAKPYYLLGNPMKVFFFIENREKQDVVLGMNSFGVPGALRMQLVSPHGEVLEQKSRADLYPVGIEGIRGAPLPNLELYPWKSGEIVTLAYDLNELFNPKQAGKHRLELTYGNTVFAQTEINLIANETVARSKFRGHHSSFFRLSINPPGLVDGILEGNIVVNKAIIEGNELWSLNIEGNKFPLRDASNLFEPLPVPVNTKILNVALDFKGQLWIVLAADTKQSLIVWNLASGSAQNVILWQAAKVEIGSTPLYDGGREPRIVIAGIEGQTKISTLSYGVETLQPAIK